MRHWGNDNHGLALMPCTYFLRLAQGGKLSNGRLGKFGVITRKALKAVRGTRLPDATFDYLELEGFAFANNGDSDKDVCEQRRVPAAVVSVFAFEILLPVLVSGQLMPELGTASGVLLSQEDVLVREHDMADVHELDPDVLVSVDTSMEMSHFAIAFALDVLVYDVAIVELLRAHFVKSSRQLYTCKAQFSTGEELISLTMHRYLLRIVGFYITSRKLRIDSTSQAAAWWQGCLSTSAGSSSARPLALCTARKASCWSSRRSGGWTLQAGIGELDMDASLSTCCTSMPWQSMQGHQR